MPDSFPTREGSAILRTADASSREEADQLQEELLIELGTEVRAVEAAGLTTVYNADDWARIAEKVRFQRDPGDTAAKFPSAGPH